MSASSMLTPLGTGGWMPTPTRETMCWLLETGGRALIFDLGSGLRRLSPAHGSDLLAACEEVTILLSHFHLDHVAAVPYLGPILGKRRVKLAVPGWRITGFAAREVLGRLTSRPLFGVPFERFGLDLSLVELDEGEHVIDGLHVRVRRQHHSDPSIAIRIDDLITYATDTGCDPGTAAFARGCHWLVHECWLDGPDFEALAAVGHPDARFHSHVDGVAEIARQSAVDQLILAHLNPGYDEARLSAMAAQARRTFARTTLPDDGVPLVASQLGDAETLNL